MSKGGGGGGSSTTTTTTTPWAEQQPYLTYGFTQAKQQYESDSPAYYEGNTLADQGAATQGAIARQIDRATNGSALQNLGRSQMEATLGGDYLNSNPHLDANFQAGTKAITDAYNAAVQGQTSNFGADSGGLGSGLQNYYKNMENSTLAGNLGDLYSKTYYDNYKTERANQMAAMSAAPEYAASDYTDIARLSEAGAAQDAYSQSVIDADIDKWNYDQNLAKNKLADYMNIVQGNYGGTGTTTQKSGRSGSGLSGALGGAASGAALGSAFGPIGTGVGALGGGLAGGK